MQIPQEKLKEWIELYLNHVREVTLDAHVLNEEGYKFRAVDTFQRHFNIDATNIREMLDEAIENNNLVVGAMYYPKKMLLHYAEKYPDDLRVALKTLFDTTKSIPERISDGFVAIEKINEKRNTDEGQEAHSFAGLRFLSLLLGYKFPLEANALKPSEWKVYCRFLNPDFRIPNHTSPGEQYRTYSEYIEPMRQYLKTLPEIKEIKEKLTEGLGFQDDEYFWVTQDVIYVTARVLAGKRSEETVEVNQASEDETDDDETFVGEAITGPTGFMPLEEYLEEYIVKNWSLINFGEPLTLYTDEDGSPAQQYTTDVGVIDILATDAKGDFVVIELKRAESGYKVVGQVLNYMGWVGDKLAEKDQKVRGLIIVGRADKTLQSALRPVSDKVMLREYHVTVTLGEPNGVSK